MKIKNLFALLLSVSLLICTVVIPTNAKYNENENVEIIIYENVSFETKTKIENYFESGEPTENNSAITYGLTCTLLGHKLEGSIVCTVNHKVSATAPRCLERTYDYEACTRCDYEKSTLIGTEYIFCCA